MAGRGFTSQWWPCALGNRHRHFGAVGADWEELSSPDDHLTAPGPGRIGCLLYTVSPKTAFSNAGVAPERNALKQPVTTAAVASRDFKSQHG